MSETELARRLGDTDLPTGADTLRELLVLFFNEFGFHDPEGDAERVLLALARQAQAAAGKGGKG